MTTTPAFWLTPILAFATAAGLTAQASQSRPDQGRTNSSNVTLTGCIERLDKTSAAYGAATAGNRNPPTTFALTRAKLATGTRAATVPEVPELSEKGRV